VGVGAVGGDEGEVVRVTREDGDEAGPTQVVAALPDAAASTIQDAVSEYEARSTQAAHCARDADKLECLIQALTTSPMAWRGR
jgi:putative hydrolase of HD superfamily